MAIEPLRVGPFIIQPSQLSVSTTRSGGAGGQHVNTTDSAVILAFDLPAAKLPAAIKTRIIKANSGRMTAEGMLKIRADRHRSQHQNHEEARERLHDLIKAAIKAPKVRRPTKPTRGSQRRRLDAKKRRGDVKKLRGKIK